VGAVSKTDHQRPQPFDDAEPLDRGPAPVEWHRVTFRVLMVALVTAHTIGSSAASRRR